MFLETRCQIASRCKENTSFSIKLVSKRAYKWDFSAVWKHSMAVFTRQQSVYFESWLEMRILNHDSKYGILDRVYAKKHRESWFEMRISNHVSDVFWSYASQITILDVFWRTHGQNTVFWIVIQDAHLESRFKSRFKIRTLPSCENSQCFLRSLTWQLQPSSCKMHQGLLHASHFSKTLLQWLVYKQAWLNNTSGEIELCFNHRALVRNENRQDET